MNFSNTLSNQAVLHEIGQRLKQYRLDALLTQQTLAMEAGVSKRTIERLEAGHSIQFENVIAVFRALNLLANLDAVIPEPGPSPMDMLKLQGKRRQRASSSENRKRSSNWKWSDSE